MSRMVRGVLVDLSGTLHVGPKEIPGSVDALRRLRKAGLPVRFVTNTTKDTTSNLVRQLKELNFEIAPEEVFSSLSAARRLIHERRLRPMLLLHPNALPDFEDVDCSQPNAVVVGLAKEAFTYQAMNQAFRVLMSQPDSTLIGIHKGRYMKDTDGDLSLGPGPFVTALEFATGKKAEVVGKPEASFFQLALDDLGVTPEDAVMVGDDVKDDIGGAMALGARGLLVRTGKYTAGDEERHGIRPDAVVDDFSAAVDWILQQQR